MSNLSRPELLGHHVVANSILDANGNEPSNTEAYRRTMRPRECSLFQIHTEQQLAEALSTDVSRLFYYGKRANRCYRTFPLGNSGRLIETPRKKLKAIQKQFHMALSAMSSPAYLVAPKRGGSNSKNAQQHHSRKGMATLDIQNFYPMCSQKAVYQFFLETMEMSKKVARLCTRLVCYRGHIPTGAPSSPIIAFRAYEPMFFHIWQNVGVDSCRMSLYIDDITVSEMRATVITPAWLETEVVDILRRYGFSVRESKTRLYGAQQPAKVTGIILMPDGELRMPNRLHKKMYDAKCHSVLPDCPESERANQRQIYVSIRQYSKHIRKASWISKYRRKKSENGRLEAQQSSDNLNISHRTFQPAQTDQVEQETQQVDAACRSNQPDGDSHAEL